MLPDWVAAFVVSVAINPACVAAFEYNVVISAANVDMLPDWVAAFVVSVAIKPACVAAFE